MMLASLMLITLNIEHTTSTPTLLPHSSTTFANTNFHLTTSLTGGIKMNDTIDAIILRYAKNLKPGESVSIPLYKGKQSLTNTDPLQAAKANKAAAAIGAKAPSKATSIRNESSFPKIMKFIETVEKPNFTKQLKDGRLYIEDIPKAKVS